MLEKINIQEIIKSFCLGLFIGLSVQLAYGDTNTIYRSLISIFISGIIGLMIGVITEFLTCLLPITIAKSNIYFLINGMIAIGFVLIMILIGNVVSIELPSVDIIKIISMILVIIVCANILDYIYYRYTNKKLEKYKGKIRK